VEVKLVLHNGEPGVDIFGVFAVELGELDTSEATIAGERGDRELGVLFTWGLLKLVGLDGSITTEELTSFFLVDRGRISNHARWGGKLRARLRARL
jgi:hypothetical protein